ncbi:MAG: riboflavin synthase [Actinomycetota bacterium]|nr:riboflavin synthase [Actinomycetota bacterium]
MFTGIVEELGEVTAVERLDDSARLRVRGPLVTSDAAHGDSIAVNGVCLTVVETGDETFTADVMRETLEHSALGALSTGNPVNLERARRLSDRLGGHLVQGHVDAQVSVLSVTPTARWTVLRVSLPDALDRYVVLKGSVTLDGVSLTVSGLGPGWLEVSLIPTTLELTTLGHRQPGDPVNLEVDLTAKYVEKLLAARPSSVETS